jgi:glutamate N-acetyltransferase / amino-acid N-acetyltransferase
MFGFVFTDAAIEKGALRRALVQAVAASFNSITVDGCMSTNDIAAVFANGAAGNAVISGGARLKEFTAALSAVCLRLAKLMVQDGEGSTKVVTIRVTQARTAEEARTAALAIANSPLFKCAMFASSHNIRGRMVAAIGAAGIPVKEQALRIRYTDLRKRDVGITVALGRGTREAVIYSSDLSYEYVKVNAQYN